MPETLGGGFESLVKSMSSWFAILVVQKAEFSTKSVFGLTEI